MRSFPFPRNNPTARTRYAGYVAQQIAALPVDKDWQVDIRPAKRGRTPPQNRYLHSLFGIIAKETGQDPESVKDTLVRHLRGVESEVVVGGVTFPKRHSTAKMSTKECAELCDEVRAWAADFGLLLPLPEECQ